MTNLPIIAIFDIGKTNKKFFLFDEEYNMLLERSTPFAEIKDEDGDACEDINALTHWVQQSLRDIRSMREFNLKAVNFSTYGASFVHLNTEGQPVAPLYNYLKPYPPGLQEELHQQYGGEITFSIHTASPALGNLNSGLQLYWLKKERPSLFEKIRHSLHLPQYMSYLLTGKKYSDITSIGCHTALWNFSQNHYHEWLFREGIIDKLAPIYPSDQLINAAIDGQPVLSGVGLHDSSAALIPYLANFNEPFVLISTGTWCISLNPFNQSRLLAEELKQDCLCYMEYRAKPVKASRLFAGYEHEQQVKRLSDHFGLRAEYYKTVHFDAAIAGKLKERPAIKGITGANGLQQSVFGQRPLADFATYEEAYHQLLMDIMQQQIASTNLVMSREVKKIFVDGGFGRNPVYMHLLARAYPQLEVYAASIAQASAVGAAMAVHAYWNKKPLPEELIDLKKFTAPIEEVNS
ncbi:FGGY family carbohydrate kinase [Paraflavitalea sp. CAU 1676]|uniref:FGGY-family carbohydrate kinase n=1 Tax=Paraflavitalea sp. CAU 1676 TaxID=3032598 RepID=UPI0023D97C00|nr:FGGY family carbohydrate kinase [Paraflavitalea sp. CAU 1676]MDF2192900.1 FGGY family carbohydrate kinase [Paraflavitalea sp. CAU 1676]